MPRCAQHCFRAELLLLAFIQGHEISPAARLKDSKLSDQVLRMKSVRRPCGVVAEGKERGLDEERVSKKAGQHHMDS